MIDNYDLFVEWDRKQAARLRDVDECGPEQEQEIRCAICGELIDEGDGIRIDRFDVVCDAACEAIYYGEGAEDGTDVA
jgi:hypothetical protein